jgi:hypothetical protein
MRVGVQVDGLKRTRDEADLEGRVVQPSPTEEARALDDVELAELGSEDVDDAQARGREVLCPSPSQTPDATPPELPTPLPK